MAIGWLSVTTIGLPDLLVGAQAKQIALHHNNGYALLRGKPDALVPQLWANGLGYKELPVVRAGEGTWRCDKFGCVALVQDKHFAFPIDPVALLEDCARTDVVLSNLRTRGCRTKRVNDYALARFGVHAFWIGTEGIRHETSADWQGRRPWSVRR